MYSEIASNKRKTWLIIALFAIIIGALGWVIGNLYGTPLFFWLALVFAGVYALIQYFAAAKLALSMNGAREVTKKEEPRLYRTVENLSIATGMPMPKVYVMEDQGLNAFATGRDPKHAVVAATRGLLDRMSDSELEAVMAHEMGHVKNFDIRVMMIVFGLVAAIGAIADIIMYSFFWNSNNRNSSPILIIAGLAAAILAPIAAMLVQFAVSRRREFLADSTGALTTRHPDALADALEKISKFGSTTKRQHTATAHLFFANPLKGKSVARWFSTHPPVEERVKRLREMGAHS